MFQARILAAASKKNYPTTPLPRPPLCDFFPSIFGLEYIHSLVVCYFEAMAIHCLLLCLCAAVSHAMRLGASDLNTKPFKKTDPWWKSQEVPPQLLRLFAPVRGIWQTAKTSTERDFRSVPSLERVQVSREILKKKGSVIT